METISPMDELNLFVAMDHTSVRAHNSLPSSLRVGSSSHTLSTAPSGAVTYSAWFQGIGSTLELASRCGLYRTSTYTTPSLAFISTNS